VGSTAGAIDGTNTRVFQKHRETLRAKVGKKTGVAFPTIGGSESAGTISQPRCPRAYSLAGIKDGGSRKPETIREPRRDIRPNWASQPGPGWLHAGRGPACTVVISKSGVRRMPTKARSWKRRQSSHQDGKTVKDFQGDTELKSVAALTRR